MEKIPNILKPIPVGELMQSKDGNPIYRFRIPSYQRGYRWNDDQVLDLLNDLFEFIYITKADYYCIQPIVVVKSADDFYEILDGQQRLTTIFILLKALKPYMPKVKSFTIAYETRIKSEQFLNTLNGDSVPLNEENPDYYYISKAYNTISEWLDKKNEDYQSVAGDLHSALVQKIQFIWYELIEETDPIEIFTRINIGKISLTNSELVKAIFLSKGNITSGIENNDEKWVNIVQSKVATEWDLIQNRLQDEHFWGFIYNGNKHYETRIDYILELKNNLKQVEHPYHTFRHFYDDIRAKKQDSQYLKEINDRNTTLIEEEWDHIKFYMDLFEDWYKDNYYYHYIGFLISQNISINEIISQYRSNNKEGFKIYIEQKIKSLFRNVSLFQLSFEKTKNIVSKALLLFNIISTYKLEFENKRFPFYKFKRNKWSVEHIYAQNSEAMTMDQYEHWLVDNIKSLLMIDNKEAKTLRKNLQDGLSNIDQLKQEPYLFQNLFSDVTKFYTTTLEDIDKDFKEERYPELNLSQINDMHGIHNLALLDAASNASLSNSLFNVKRMLIIGKDKAGTYIPPETKRVFLKYHTEYPDHLFYWTKEDKASYMYNIFKTIGHFFNN